MTMSVVTTGDVTTPKLPPPPRTAQNRSWFSSALPRNTRPSAVTNSTDCKLSRASPYFPISHPMPPPSVSPAIPVVDTTPPVTAKPCDAFLNHPIPKSKSSIPIPSCRLVIGMRSKTGPSRRTIQASTPSPPAVPSAAGRQPRNVATASTIVKASTTSTSEAKNAALIAGAAVDQDGIFLSSAILVMRLEDALRVRIEQAFAALQPLRGFGREPAAIKIQLSYLFEPALQLLELDIVFFELVVSEVLRCRFFGDVGFEIIAFVDEFAICIVAICLETSDNFFVLSSVESDR